MQKNIKINGVDYTAWTPPTGYTVTPKYVYGSNSMTMTTGEEYKDEMVIKSVVEVPFLPLTDSKLHALMQNLYSGIKCLVEFYDPDLGTYRTMRANRSVNKRKFRGLGADGNYYWTALIVEFEE